MGVSYELFLLLFGISNACFGVLNHANRTSSTLYGRVLRIEPMGKVMAMLSALGQVAWPGLMIIGFLSLRWYLVIALVLLPGVAATFVYSFFVPRNENSVFTGIYLAGIFGALVFALTAFLWVQRLMH